VVSGAPAGKLVRTVILAKCGHFHRASVRGHVVIVAALDGDFRAFSRVAFSPVVAFEFGGSEL
jgi:hypothetical protein